MTRESDSIVIVERFEDSLSGKPVLEQDDIFFSRIIAITAPIKIVKVVVLIPPPVEPGDAPMNIRMMMKNCVACRSEAISSVLAPAVLGVTDWKKEANILPPQSREPSVIVLENSNTKITIVPNAIRSSSHREHHFGMKGQTRLFLRYSIRSDITIKPSTACNN